MNEPYLTMAEIKKMYPNEWVLIDNPKLSRTQEILAGRVVLHAADRAEFDRLWDAWDDSDAKMLGIWYTGRYPELDDLPVGSEPGAA